MRRRTRGRKRTKTQQAIYCTALIMHPISPDQVIGGLHCSWTSSSFLHLLRILCLNVVGGAHRLQVVVHPRAFACLVHVQASQVVGPRIPETQPLDTIMPSEGMYWPYISDLLASRAQNWCMVLTQNALKMLHRVQFCRPILRWPFRSKRKQPPILLKILVASH